MGEESAIILLFPRPFSFMLSSLATALSKVFGIAAVFWNVVVDCNAVVGSTAVSLDYP